MELKELIEREFSALGFNLIYFNTPPSANGVDCWVQKSGKRPLSVEIKAVRKQKKGIFQTDPVSKCRKNDDLIAIVINPEYVLIEAMQDHLKCCSPKGTRQFTLLNKGD